MRIPSGVTDQYIYFVAVDSTDYATRETGLSSFTVYRSRNGAAAAAMTTPTINETDSTNMPGVYELLLDEDMTIGSGNDSEEMVFHITATGMAPVTRTIELYRSKITAGNTLDVTATGAAGIDWGNVENASTSVDLSSTSINLCDTVTTNTDMRGTDSALLAASAPTNFGDMAITVTTGQVTVGTNNDKTGYSISGTKTTLDALNDVSTAEVNAQCDTAISDAALATAANLATVDANVDAILLDTNELQGDWTNGGRLDLLLDQVITDIAALNDLSAAQVNAEVLDVLNVDTFAEPTGVPAATDTLVTKLGYLYMALRNRVDVTSTKKTFYDDAGTAEWEKDLSDNGTTYSESEGNAI